MPRQAIFILTDTQGTDVIGCYGRPEMRTPNIDRMASEGIRFDRAYSTQPVCGPARSALFTGLYPHSNGVLGNDMAPSIDAQTIGQRLTAAGVRTGYVGKWHLDGFQEREGRAGPPSTCGTRRAWCRSRSREPSRAPSTSVPGWRGPPRCAP